MKNLVILSVFSLIGCASSNIGSEWDCPATEGLSCVTISEADRYTAHRDVKQRRGGVVKLGLESKYKIEFSEYTDKRGNVHEKSVIRVGEEDA